MLLKKMKLDLSHHLRRDRVASARGRLELPFADPGFSIFFKSFCAAAEGFDKVDFTLCADQCIQHDHRFVATLTGLLRKLWFRSMYCLWGLNTVTAFKLD